MNFDPTTGVPIDPKKQPPSINTRTFLYHEIRPAIVVEGRGSTDAEKREDVAKQIRSKQKEGYSLTRFDGQHPHSFDDHRMDAQRRAAENGDKDAKAALAAKAKIQPATEQPPDIGALQAQLAVLQEQVAKLTKPAEKV